jgi:hypothetical protein
MSLPLAALSTPGRPIQDYVVFSRPEQPYPFALARG